jgi:hypothetical protein
LYEDTIHAAQRQHHDANEIVVEAAKTMRNNAGPDEQSLVTDFNAHMLELFSGQAAPK